MAITIWVKGFVLGTPSLVCHVYLVAKFLPICKCRQSKSGFGDPIWICYATVQSTTRWRQNYKGSRTNHFTLKIMGLILVFNFYTRKKQSIKSWDWHFDSPKIHVFILAVPGVRVWVNAVPTWDFGEGPKHSVSIGGQNVSSYREQAQNVHRYRCPVNEIQSFHYAAQP